MKITLKIEKAENGYVVTRTNETNGISEIYVCNNFTELLAAMKNMVGCFE